MDSVSLYKRKSTLDVIEQQLLAGTRIFDVFSSILMRLIYSTHDLASSCSTCNNVLDVYSDHVYVSL